MSDKTVKEYIDALPAERKEAITKLQKIILKNLPKGFVETISYGMIGYVVPHSKYPDGYHCNPKLPLPFMTLASQKKFIALHHLGLYSSEKLLKWFTEEYPKHSKIKIDMGKGCVRFKKAETIPYDLIGELCSKMTVEKWIEVYESNLKRNKTKN